MKIIGLTGGIGSGKSTVSKILLSHKIPVYDSDSRAKYLMNYSSKLKNKIIENFGENSYINNVLNKNYISGIVFNNKLEMNKINLLVHPFVYEDFNSWKKNFFSKYIIFESALIFETGFYKRNDFNILVISEMNERIKRVVKRDFVDEKDVIVRIKNQWNDKKKIPLSDYIIKNINYKQTEVDVIKMINSFNKKFL